MDGLKKKGLGKLKNLHTELLLIERLFFLKKVESLNVYFIFHWVLNYR